MAKEKAKKQDKPITALHHKVASQSVIVTGQEDLLPDLNDPDEFRRAFIAAEIINRKYC